MTGAGRGIGRAHVRLLAERGASVVVNDLGGSADGSGSDANPAASVAAEIVSAGGTAVADSHDVSSPEGAAALIDRAIDAFGRVDIIVNNAGIIRWAGMPKADAANLDAHLAVHVHGSFNTVRAAWPHFVEQAYGRVVMTTSAGMFGLRNNLGYATAKGGVVGLTRSLAVAGAPHGIKVNLLAPAAYSRMAGPGADDAAIDDDPAAAAMSPDLVAPMAAYLAHEDCPVSGEMYAAGGRRFARIFIATSPGFVHLDGEPTIEDMAMGWHLINDETGYTVPTDLMDWSADFLSHLDDEPGASS